MNAAFKQYIRWKKTDENNLRPLSGEKTGGTTACMCLDFAATLSLFRPFQTAGFMIMNA